MRSVPEWIGKTDDTPVPPRVRLRVLDRDGWRCQGEDCGRNIRIGTPFQTDHIIALVNGGKNRESNLQSLCDDCHAIKTRADVKAKAKTARIKKRSYGLRRARGRPMPGTRASGIRKRMDGRVERW